MLKVINIGLAITALSSALLSPSVWATDEAVLASGERLFTYRCAACHTLSAADGSMFGPHLEGLLDRRAGTVDDYEYTIDLMREQAFVWDEAQFDAWLEKPQEMIPGMCVPYRGLRKPEDREALIAYMKQETL